MFKDFSEEDMGFGRAMMRRRRILRVAAMAVLSVAFITLAITGTLAEKVVISIIGIVGLAVSIFLLGFFLFREDKVRADQTEQVLTVASESSDILSHGLTEDSAYEVCKLLMTITDAASVSINYGGECIGHAGADVIWDRFGDPVPIPWARQMFEYGAESVVRGGNDEDGLPSELKACVTSLIRVNDTDQDFGTIKLYYRSRADIGETQIEMSVGFAKLISVELAQYQLATQTEIATKMELRALQAQINPHFLFNTINTIASLIRTDAKTARELLREFAVFYRRTLENSQDNITVALELEQTVRYLRFEMARFGEDRIRWNAHIEPGLENIPVPAFVIQPLVENSVGHAMRDTGEPLHIFVDVRSSGENSVIIDVSDDGVGMDASKISVAVKSDGSKGAGIALKNVDERLKSFYGPSSGLKISSELGVGTTCTLTLADAKSRLE